MDSKRHELVQSDSLRNDGTSSSQKDEISVSRKSLIDIIDEPPIYLIGNEEERSDKIRDAWAASG